MLELKQIDDNLSNINESFEQIIEEARNALLLKKFYEVSGEERGWSPDYISEQMKLAIGAGDTYYLTERGNVRKEPSVVYYDDMSYLEYMDEILMEATQEMDAYLEATHKVNYYYRDNLQKPFIAETLKKKAVQDSIIEFTGKFMDDHSTQLHTSGPVYIFTFADKETTVLYDLFGLSKEKVLEISKGMFDATYSGAGNFHLVREAPHKVLLTAILVEAIQQGYTDIITCVEYLMGFAEYPLVYRRYWKTGVQEPIMKHTIEHLPNKFKAKKVSNLLGLLKYDMSLSISFFTEQLKTGADHSWINFIYRVRTQLNATFKNISREYYKNHETNATQHSKAGKTDDGHLADGEGHTALIGSIVENTYNKFLTGGVNAKLAAIAAENAQVDGKNTLAFINSIMTTKNNRLYKFIENVVTAYLTNNPTNTSVGSGEFMNFGLALYRSISTSKNPLYIEIKEILHLWLYTVIDIKQYSNREGTWINYTRAIFNYMIMMINHHN